MQNAVGKDPTERAQQMTRRMLGKQLFVIHTTPVAPREQIVPLLPDHLEHQIRLEKSGIMFGAGPMVNEDGSPAGGLIVIRAESFAAAKVIADSDPLHKPGCAPTRSANGPSTRAAIRFGSTIPTRA